MTRNTGKAARSIQAESSQTSSSRRWGSSTSYVLTPPNKRDHTALFWLDLNAQRTESDAVWMRWTSVCVMWNAGSRPVAGLPAQHRRQEDKGGVQELWGDDANECLFYDGHLEFEATEGTTQGRLSGGGGAWRWIRGRGPIAFPMSWAQNPLQRPCWRSVSQELRPLMEKMVVQDCGCLPVFLPLLLFLKIKVFTSQRLERKKKQKTPLDKKL